jgi:MFS transporter, DHA2 family, multidrug resistance protein
MRISAEVDFQTVVWMRILQEIGLPLIFIPISTLSYVGMRQQDNNHVSGISNFVRNLRGAIGTSFLVSYLTRHQQVSRVDLVSHLHRGNVSLTATWRACDNRPFAPEAVSRTRASVLSRNFS